MDKKLLLIIMFSALSGLNLNAQWQPIGPGGGIVRAFASGGSNIFAGTFGGGVFLTSNNGTLWTPVNNGLTNTDVQALAVTNSGATVFAGTYAGGVFLSTNGGSSWTAVNSGLTNLFVSSLAIKGTTIFAGTIGGVFISTDNGTSWTAVNNGLGTTLDVLCLAVSGTDILVGTGTGGVFLSANDGGLWNPKNSGIGDIYVNSLAVSGTKLFAGNNNGVYSSTDNGNSWSIAKSTPGLVKSINVNGTIIYAGYGTMTSGGIAKSPDNGVSWSTVNNGLPSGNGIYAVLQSGSIVFAGTDGKGLYTTTTSGALWNSDDGITNSNALSLSLATIGTNIFAGVFGGGVYLSTNNGSGPWTPVNSGLPSNSINVLATGGTTVFVGTYANGVYRSTDNGTSWTAMNTNLTNLNVTSFAFSGTTIYAGTLGGGVFKSTISGSAWTPVNTGLSNNQIQSLVASGTKVFAGTYYGGVFFSNTSGGSWAQVNNGLSNLNVNTLAMSGTRVFAGTVGGVFSSSDNGGQWMIRNIGLTNLSAMSLCVSGTKIFLGTDGGGVFFSNDSANHWTAVNTGLTITNNIPAIAVSDTCVFAGTHGCGVFKRNMSDFDCTITSQSSNASTCAGNDINFSVAASGIYVSYQWQVSTDGGTVFYDCYDGAEYSGVSTNTLTVLAAELWYKNGFQYHCIITSGLPVNSTLATLSVSDMPNLSITNPVPVCLPNTADITNSYSDLNSTVGTVSYWTDAGATIPVASPAAINTSGTYYVKKTTTIGSCSDIKPVIVIISAVPDLSISNPAAVCEPNTVDITNTFTDLNSTTGSVSYWTDAGATISVTTPAAITTGGTYYIKKTTTGTCSDIQPVTVTINATPNLSVTNPPAICFPNTVDITISFSDLNSTTGTVSYWMDSAATVPLTIPTAVGTSGTYFIKKVASGGCWDIISVKVIIRPLPTVNYTQNPLFVCVNDAPITLTGGSPVGGTYSGTGVTTSPIFNPLMAGAGIWNIVYSYTDVYTCSATASQNIEVDLCTGIQPELVSSEAGLKIFPNPFTTSLTLTGFVSPSDLLMYNILGEQVGSWEIINTSTTLETGNLPSGVYLLQIKTEHGAVTKKIVKE